MLNIFLYYTPPKFYPVNLQHSSCKLAFSIRVENNRFSTWSDGFVKKGFGWEIRKTIFNYAHFLDKSMMVHLYGHRSKFPKLWCISVPEDCFSLYRTLQHLWVSRLRIWVFLLWGKYHMKYSCLLLHPIVVFAVLNVPFNNSSVILLNKISVKIFQPADLKFPFWNHLQW